MPAFPAATAPYGPKVVSVSMAAEILDICRSKIYELFNEGELAWIQIGRRRVVEVSELERFLAAHRVRRDSACEGAMPGPTEQPAPPTADADQGQGARPAPLLHRQNALKGTGARRSRTFRPGLKSGDSPA